LARLALLILLVLIILGVHDVSFSVWGKKTTKAKWVCSVNSVIVL
jgi:hypothetical protein